MLDVDHIIDACKAVGDALSLGVALATVFAWLPQIAAAASLVWTVIRFVEWLGKR